jgi:hypothetical protein
MNIYIPTPVVVENALVFEARIPHDGQLITITKPSGGAIELRYGETHIPHDKYYQDTVDGVHQASFTLPNQHRIVATWVPRPMRYEHIHIQTPRLLVQISTSNTPRV